MPSGGQKDTLPACTVVTDSFPPHGLWPSKLLCPSDFSGKDTEVGCHFLLQGIFPDAGIQCISLALAGGFLLLSHQRSPGSAVVKNLPANSGDARHPSLIPGLGRSPGVGNSNPPQCSRLENPMDREAWQVTVHGVAKSQT